MPHLPHIDFSRNRRRGEGGAAFLEQVDGVLGFGCQCINLGGFAVKEGGDGFLFKHRWHTKNAAGRFSGAGSFLSCVTTKPNMLLSTQAGRPNSRVPTHALVQSLDFG